METYTIKHLTFTYPTTDTPALRDIHLTINQGEFVTLCGHSGSGKTTLLRHLKPSITPHGAKSGAICFEGTPLDALSPRDAAAKIGFVFQCPENQMVTDKVWHELAFGLESLGYKTPEIRLRVAEMASFFGIQSWFHQSVAELSGGQKQMLSLASVMALQPTALILDEPTSQLDPIAAGEFLTTLGKINRELGVTVILTEHRLEEAFPLSSRAIVMEAGQVIADGAPAEVGAQLRCLGSGMFAAMPTPMRVWAAAPTTAKIKQPSGFGSPNASACAANNKSTPHVGNIPLTVRDGARWLARQPVNAEKIPATAATAALKPAVSFTDVWFKYEKNLPDVVKDLSFTAHYGKITAILGGNGTGKTTTLSLIAGINKPYRGKIRTDATVYALPQNPQTLFVAKTVREDLLEVLSAPGQSKAEKTKKLTNIVKLCRLESMLDRHPYDLSGGEQQRAALAKVLLLQPKILLLDEPTKGLDAEYKQIFAAILRRLTEAGAAVVMVSHDIEFCAENADSCGLFFDGNIVTAGAPRAFFGGNSFYTTAANRMGRGVLPHAITANDIILALGGKAPPAPMPALDGAYDMADAPLPPPPACPKLSGKRRFFFLASALWFLAAVFFAVVNRQNLAAFIGGGMPAVSIAEGGARFYVALLMAAAVGINGMVLALSWRRGKAVPLSQKRPLSKRTVVAAAFILFTIPLTIYLGVTLLDDRRFYFVSMLIILQTMLPFLLVFESRKPHAREIIVIAVLCAIAVAGRSAFFMLPQFKPVVAMVIIAGVAFGGEAGFLVGAATGFVSNMFFGQGPWTPWQMFALGIIGFLAGVLFRKGLLGRGTASLAVFGGFATFIIYGGIMNPASVIMWQPSPTLPMFVAAYIQGIPFDLVHAAATVTFLLVIARPMLEKLDRIKVKYGLEPV